ncbi:hypothetical protein NMY22_g445 [Coprinellus aureogranulatus]|nr:hypothetical protein NMY22_g445 [Coprinellus aureogranulatus]
MADRSPYEAASAIPLIKNPGLRVPQKVELPPDIHPLPDSVTPYFVYPFTLEPHVLTLESSRRSTIAAHTARREDYLRQREAEKERRKKEALKRIAPGFDPTAVLVPESRQGHKASTSVDTGLRPEQQNSPVGHQRSRSVMDDLVDTLAALDAAKSPPPPAPVGSVRSPPVLPPPPPPVNQTLH